MREVVACIHPVRIHSAQILNLELDQGPCQLSRVAQLLSKFIRLELIAAAQDIHEKLDYGVHWSESVRKEDEADDYRELVVEAKRIVKGVIVDEDGE